MNPAVYFDDKDLVLAFNSKIYNAQKFNLLSCYRLLEIPLPEGVLERPELLSATILSITNSTAYSSFFQNNETKRVLQIYMPLNQVLLDGRIIDINFNKEISPRAYKATGVFKIENQTFNFRATEAKRLLSDYLTYLMDLYLPNEKEFKKPSNFWEEF